MITRIPLVSRKVHVDGVTFAVQAGLERRPHALAAMSNKQSKALAVLFRCFLGFRTGCIFKKTIPWG